MNKNSNNFEAYENIIESNASVNYTIIDIGGKNSITNYYSNILGEKAKNDLKTIYLGAENNIKDLNYIPLATSAFCRRTRLIHFHWHQSPASLCELKLELLSHTSTPISSSFQTSFPAYRDSKDHPDPQTWHNRHGTWKAVS